jgi:hypothetical protein
MGRFNLLAIRTPEAFFVPSRTYKQRHVSYNCECYLIPMRGDYRSNDRRSHPNLGR